MAVPAGIPMMLVFTGIFVFLVLFIACIVLSFIVEEKMMRVGLILAAFMLVMVMGGGAYMTMMDAEEEPAEQAKAVVEQPAQAKPDAAQKPQKPQKTQKTQSSEVVVVVDESTITEDYDPLKTDRLSVEDPQKGKKFNGNARQERKQVGQKITAIENDLDTAMDFINGL